MPDWRGDGELHDGSAGDRYPPWLATKRVAIQGSLIRTIRRTERLMQLEPMPIKRKLPTERDAMNTNDALPPADPASDELFRTAKSAATRDACSFQALPLLERSCWCNFGSADCRVSSGSGFEEEFKRGLVGSSSAHLATFLKARRVSSTSVIP